MRWQGPHACDWGSAEQLNRGTGLGARIEEEVA